MYSVRTESQRIAQFDKTCTNYTLQGIKYITSASEGKFIPQESGFTSILIDYLDTAIDSKDSNTALQDLVLDNLILSTR